ncbi:alpha/beta hydrolase [Halieaceae bacterium IMCC14734]|uniref:Alpha/beta hydrolase n=1 Tax=Candidatus Litorirhabdus singularis TaxID=2518993 RepID=A0ABT3TIS0_9GAMM|nr:alpha/beta hydrolase [Candidatus Litorirhabdus singularis]MCX2982226.1 alpha/beta hydrolase [Candidatus Litorirhabdus singularis]
MSYPIDTELTAILEYIPASDFSDPVATRKNMKDMMQLFGNDTDESGINITDTTIPGMSGAPDIPLRIYRPEESDAITAGLLYIHGGGFAVGDLDSEHSGVVSMCRSLGIVIVSVDYRLAPEDPYPAGLEDCYTALQWVHQQATTLGIDATRIGVRGGSAGGGLAAALALLTRDRSGPSLCFQFLGIPELDDRLSTVSMIEFTDTPLWHRGNAILSWQYYLGDKYQPGAEGVPYTAAPARADIEDLRGLPPAYVSTMEFDPLRDEGIQYALKLLQAGVATELHSFPGTYHGSEMVLEAAVTKRGNGEGLEALRRGLGL